MTCKDCIHESVCEKLCPKGLLPYHSSEYPAELFCLEFKNKADFVEVVRCKDCKFAPVHPTDSQKLVCTKSVNWRAVELEHFCSYGKRRTDERKAD